MKGELPSGDQMRSGPTGGELTSGDQERSRPPGKYLQVEFNLPAGREVDQRRSRGRGARGMRLADRDVGRKRSRTPGGEVSGRNQRRSGPLCREVSSDDVKNRGPKVLRGGHIRGLKLESLETPEKLRWVLASAGEGSSSMPAVPLEVQRPLPPRYPAYPKSGSIEAVEEWILKCSKLAEEEAPSSYPHILSKPKDLQTAKAVASLTDHQMLLNVGASVVSISTITPDGKSAHYTGFFFAYDDSKHVRILTCSEAVCDHEGKPLENHKLLVHLLNGKSLEAYPLFYNDYYGMALLAIPDADDMSLPCVHFAFSLNHGDKVFILSRDEDLELMTRSGCISCSEEPYLDCNCYLYLDGQLPKCGSGGLVIDKNGNMAGMSLELGCRKPAVLSRSIICMCIEMETRFGCIARPMLGLSLTTVDLLDLSKKDKLLHRYNIDSGYVVNEVSVNSDAEKFGIRCGDVITSINGMSSLTLPELEEKLLSLGWSFLESHSNCKVLLTLQFCDLEAHYGRSIDLPVAFTCSKRRIEDDEDAG